METVNYKNELSMLDPGLINAAKVHLKNLGKNGSFESRMTIFKIVDTLDEVCSLIKEAKK